MHATVGASLGYVTTPLADLPLLPPPRAAAATPGSTISLTGGGGIGSLLAYRNSLGSVSEWEHGGSGAGGGDGAVVSSGAEEAFDGLPEEEDLEERDLFAEGGPGVEGMRALWDSTTSGDGG